MSPHRRHALARAVWLESGSTLVTQVVILAPLSVVIALALMLTLARPY